jgi:hypothetical protein
MTDEYMDLRCRWCGQRFYVCLRCYHGEAYCCQECAAEGYRAVQDEARARHQSSEEGKEDHRDWMRESRAHENKAVTDEGIVKLPDCGKVAPDFEKAPSRVDEPAPEVEEHSDVATICDEAPLRPWPSARPVRATTWRTARCAMCGTILVLRPTPVQPRAG